MAETETFKTTKQKKTKLFCVTAISNCVAMALMLLKKNTVTFVDRLSRQRKTKEHMEEDS